MDDFDFQVFEDELFLSEMNNKPRTEPDWWLIALGQKESTMKEWRKANEIYHEFLAFTFKNKGISFEEQVDLFTVAKMQNRLPAKRVKK